MGGGKWVPDRAALLQAPAHGTDGCGARRSQGACKCRAVGRSRHGGIGRGIEPGMDLLTT